jgi:WD40 repeat protein
MNIDDLAHAATEDLRAVSRPPDPDAMMRELKRTRHTRAVGRATTAGVAVIAAAITWHGLHTAQPPAGPVTPPIVPRSNGAIVFTGAGGAGAAQGVIPHVPDDAVLQSDLSWSPDGSTLAYQAAGGRLALMNVETGQTRTVGACHRCDFAWSPTGAVIAVTRGLTLRLLETATGDSTQVPIGALYPRQPTWAPDGARIAFVAPTADGRAGLYAIDADGSNETLLWRSAPRGGAGEATTIGPWDPAWSPDGRTIAFINSNLWAPVPKVAGWHLNITTVTADGSGASKRLVDIGTCACFGFSPALTWSPDGSALAVTAETRLGWGLHIVRADGTGLRFVDTQARGPTGAEGPIAWQPRPE